MDVDDAAEIVWDHILSDLKKGDVVECPGCGQTCKVYDRIIHSSMARGLITVWWAAGRQWCRPADYITRVQMGDFAKLAYWGLIEESDERRPDGGRAGVWRITADGEAFVHDELEVPKYARVYAGEVLEHHGREITIVNSLGKKFNYRELMSQ